MHKSYQEQLQELETERIGLFGPNDDDDDDENIRSRMNGMQTCIDEMNKAREELYNFSNEEKQAWANIRSSTSNHQLSPELMDNIRQAKEAQIFYETQMQKETNSKMDQIIQNINTTSTKYEEENNPIFTHLNKSGEEVSMVDVGDKTVSKRVAVARSSVWFPPEVMEAFGLDYDHDSTKLSSDVVGPKGPIFATARIAGIMGAK